MPYVYPPLTALLFFVSLSFLPAAAASLVWNSASLVALGAVVWLTLGIAGLRDTRAKIVLTVAGVVLAAWLLPVRLLLVAGQINMFLVLLVLLDFRRPDGRWKGIGIGVAAGLKVTPLIFIVYLLLTRRWAAARNATLAFLGTMAIGILILPADSLKYWGGLVFQSARVGGIWDTPNQSLAGAIARVSHADAFANWWLIVLALVAAAGLAAATHAYRRGADFLGFSAAAITGLLISPFSWEHHWVYIIPLLVWLACWAWRERSIPVAIATAALVTVFTVRTFMLVGIPEAPSAPLPLAWWQELVASPFPLAGLVLLVLGPLWVRRHFPPKPATGADVGSPTALDSPLPARMEATPM
jgi:alpha-1,2-mannosyltransferase